MFHVEDDGSQPDQIELFGAFDSSCMSFSNTFEYRWTQSRLPHGQDSRESMFRVELMRLDIPRI